MTFEGPRTPRDVPGEREESREDEYISTAALEYRGQVFRGGNHGDALTALEEAVGEDYMTRDVRDGFVTSKDRFVDRIEADEIAERNDQIIGRSRGFLDSNWLKKKE